jgi:hypothetical protein
MHDQRQIDADGKIVHSVSFIIVDKGEDVFSTAYRRCCTRSASNHDQHVPGRRLIKRMVGYLTIYDRRC